MRRELQIRITPRPARHYVVTCRGIDLVTGQPTEGRAVRVNLNDALCHLLENAGIVILQDAAQWDHPNGPRTDPAELTLHFRDRDGTETLEARLELPMPTRADKQTAYHLAIEIYDPEGAVFPPGPGRGSASLECLHCVLEEVAGSATNFLASPEWLGHRATITVHAGTEASDFLLFAFHLRPLSGDLTQ